MSLLLEVGRYGKDKNFCDKESHAILSINDY